MKRTLNSKTERQIGKMLAKKKGVDIVGAIDIGDKIGKSLYDVVPGIQKGDREDVIVGTPEEVMTTEDLEKAYGVPAAMLKNGEDIKKLNPALKLVSAREIGIK